ncbi:hypothetical protein M885DRAFT_483645 [Pelagophyceae sp. CCMP2097]|nr:hypothetical protein M885DRAFT_483645 [Pelagophyceae sp. CCMP2097]
MVKKNQSTSFNGQRVTPKGKRYLEARAPKVHENPKAALLLRGSKTSDVVSAALKSVAYFKSPHAQFLNRRREDLRPLEDAAELERMLAKYDAALFAVASHSKKRPHNLLLGRAFDGTVLDMFEFAVVDPGPSTGIEKMAGSKPCLIFVGDWDCDDKTKRLRNFMADFLRGADVGEVNLAGLESVVQVSLTRPPPGAPDAKDGVLVSVAPFRLRLTKSASGEKLPDVNLEPSGAAMKLALRRDHQPAFELFKASLRQPRELKPKKRKSVKTTALGDTLGTLHVERQDTDKIQSRKVRALRGPGDKPQRKAAAEKAAD